MTIKIGNTRLKVFNCLVFLLVIILIIYLVATIFFMLPNFNSEYKYEINKSNYNIKVNTKFKHAWFNCHVKEIYDVTASDELIKHKLLADLKDEGFKIKGKYLYRKYTYSGLCRDDIKTYKKEHNSVIFNLNDKDSITLNYKEEYNDPYVTLKVNEKNSKNINVNSDFNSNKIGTYIVSYNANISKYYTEKLYRKIKIVDTEKPEITLNDSDVVVEYGKNYVEPGYKATDNYDGDITKKVVVKNTVNNKKSGLYKVTYSVRDSSGNKFSVIRNVEVKEKSSEVNKEQSNIEVKDGITYVNGILLVNKTYGLPKDYDPKVNKEAKKALESMQADAKVLGLKIPLVSGYRSYITQENLYNKYVKKDGEEEANTYSAKPGHSEHQTGLAFDVGSVERSFANTDEAKWLEENAHLYGFIVRYPKDKTDITGYIYEPWHIRYLGKDNAKKVYESGLTLEEYLGIQ